MLNIDEYRQIRKDYFGETKKEASKGYIRYKNSKPCFIECVFGEQMSDYNIYADCEVACDKPVKKKVNCLAPLPKAVPCPCVGLDYQQEGKTPMRYNDNYASASANVSSRPSDSEVARDYLIGRLRDADYPKQQALSELFNLYKDNTPKTYKEMIDIIKAGTYTIDAKIAKKIDACETEDDDCCMSTAPLWGIIWPGPVADYDGYSKAMTEKKNQRKEAEGVVMTSDAATGLTAVKAFEAWLPTTATATAQ